jgi:hypothetical protein
LAAQCAVRYLLAFERISAVGYSLDNRIHGISTILTSTWSDSESIASGFFFQHLSSPDPEKEKSGEGYWRKVEALWLITNRHVLFSDDGLLACSLTFQMRRAEKSGCSWHAITLDEQQIKERARFHKNPEVDVAAIKVDDLTSALFVSKKEVSDWMAWHAVSPDNFPGKNKISVEVADDVLIIGYPRGYYDQHNKFPIVKSGIIASGWGLPFGGQPYFLIDAKLFPGSSGSIVITKPIDHVVDVEKAKISWSESKQFAILGVFSGEPFQESTPIELDNLKIISKEGFNVGIVWYQARLPISSTAAIG